MNKINLKLYFKKRKQRLSVFGISIKFDWRFILIVALVLLLAGIAYATLLYVQIMNGSLLNVVEDESPQIQIEQKRADIRKVTDQLEQHSFDENLLN